MRRVVEAPLKALAPVRHRIGHAVKTKRLGSLRVDHGLDVLTFFLADVQTGFGPFIAVYLAANGWTAAEIGAALGIGTVVGFVAQVPAGAAIDAIPAKRLATLVGLLAVLGSALLLAAAPHWAPVVGAEFLHGVASCMLLPAVAAVTLSRVGRAAFAPRLGRNTRFMAIGNGIGAGVMGFAGAHIAAAAPFWFAALGTVPAMLALWALPPRHESEPPAPKVGLRQAVGECGKVLRGRGMLAFIVCVVLFHGGNAFILPLAVTRLTHDDGVSNTNLVLAACLVISQTAVALISPRIGHWAQAWGRRPVLLIGFAAVPLHAGLLALAGGPTWVVGLQLLDGVGGAMFGIMQPLIAADVAHGTNRFNLCMGILGLAAALGASASSVIGGAVAAHVGDTTAFAALAATGGAAVLAVWALMPETRRRPQPAARRDATAEA